MGLLFGQFESAYLINLPERTDRRRQSERELKRIGWEDEVTIVPACKFDSPDGFRNRGERGCFHSHLRSLKTLAMSGQSGIVLEDDIAFSPTIPDLSNMIAKSLALPDWDMVYFGHESTGDIPRANRRTRCASFRTHDTSLLTTHFYGVHKRIAGRLVLFLEEMLTRPPGDPRGGPMPIDGALWTFRKQNPDVQTLIAVPKLGWQRSSRSDLAPATFDSIRGLRRLVAAARSLKNALS